MFLRAVKMYTNFPHKDFSRIMLAILKHHQKKADYYLTRRFIPCIHESNLIWCKERLAFILSGASYSSQSVSTLPAFMNLGAVGTQFLQIIPNFLC